MATHIAFVLGVLALPVSGVPTGLKSFFPALVCYSTAFAWGRVGAASAIGRRAAHGGMVLLRAATRQPAQVRSVSYFPTTRTAHAITVEADRGS